jgi:hypothetical protein
VIVTGTHSSVGRGLGESYLPGLSSMLPEASSARDREAVGGRSVDGVVANARDGRDLSCFAQYVGAAMRIATMRRKAQSLPMQNGLG